MKFTSRYYAYALIVFTEKYVYDIIKLQKQNEYLLIFMLYEII